MNLALRICAGIIDLLQFIFFVVLLAFQFITPVGGGVTGAAAGAYLCYNASSGVISGLVAGLKCAVGGTIVGAGLSAFAAPAGIAIDIALSCTFGVLLVLMLWVTGRFSFMAVILGFGSEMLPGLNAFSPGWSILVHRCIQQYNKKQKGAASSPRTLGFLVQAASTVMPELTVLSAARAGSRYMGAPAAPAPEQRQSNSRIPLQTKNFDGIRPANDNVPRPTYVKAA